MRLDRLTVKVQQAMVDAQAAAAEAGHHAIASRAHDLEQEITGLKTDLSTAVASTETLT